MFYLKSPLLIIFLRMDVWKNKEKSLKTPWKCTLKVLEKCMLWSVGTMVTVDAVTPTTKHLFQICSSLYCRCHRCKLQWTDSSYTQTNSMLPHTVDAVTPTSEEVENFLSTSATAIRGVTIYRYIAIHKEFISYPNMKWVSQYIAVFLFSNSTVYF